MNRTSLIVSLTSILVVVAVAAGFLVAGARPELGLDLQGGISAALRPDPEAASQPEDMDQALDLAVQLIRQRVDSLGVSEPDIARQGDDTILVQLPGITDAERAREIIGQTAQLTFHPVEQVLVPGIPQYTATPPCVVQETDANGDPVLDAQGDPVYAPNPDRPRPSQPVDGTRYVCGEVPESGATDEPEEQETSAPPPDRRIEDLITESETPGATEEPTDAGPTSTETATEEPTGDALGAVEAAQESTPTEAPTPTQTATDGTGQPTPEPTIDDGLPADAPRPPKYIVGDIPTTTGPLRPEAPTASPTDAATDQATEAPTDAATGGVRDGDPLTGDDITDASPTIGQSGWVVQLEFDSDGAEAFRRVTSRLACVRDRGAPNQRGQLAIVLDDVVQSAPEMQSTIACGEGIAGGATITMGGQGLEESQAEARDLALILNVGALPVTLTEATFENVSPSLGAASLRNGLIAGLIGLLLVGIYLLSFYRMLGLVALGGLAIFGVLVIGTITLMGLAGFALTLAGVAGIIVAIGITADSSILFFERIREEVALGKTMRTASRKAFQSAFRTNLAGNTVTLAAALILYFLAVGPVRGFAFTLGLATILDIIILWAWTRSVVGLLSGARRLTRDSVRVPTEPSAPEPSTGGAA